MKRELLCMVIGLLCGPVTLSAQKQVKGEVRADVVSHYMWRGLDKGGFSVQPQATVRWQGLSLQMYGSAGLNKEDNDELDLSLRYERAGFSIPKTDICTIVSAMAPTASRAPWAIHAPTAACTPIRCSAETTSSGLENAPTLPMSN